MKKVIDDFQNASKRIVYTTTALALLLAFFISGPLLNLFMNYTVAGGSALEKLHPFVWVIAMGWMIDFFFARRGKPWEFDQYSGLIMAWIVPILWLFAIGSVGFVSVVLNNFVFPLILVRLIVRLDRDRVLGLARIFLGLMLIQVFLLVGEFATGRTLFPSLQEFYYFRPAGFSGHPLFAGQFALLAILMTKVAVENPVTSRILLLIFTSSLFIIGSRSALVIGAILSVIELISPHQKRKNALIAVFDLGITFLMGLAAFVALGLGGFDRLLERGLWDTSAQSRIAIFDIFDLFDRSEILYGVSPERLSLYLDFLSQNYVESTFVTQVVFGGIFLAIAAHAIIIASFVPVFRASPMFFGTMMAILASSLALSSKGSFPVLAYIAAAITIVLFKHPPEPSRS